MSCNSLTSVTIPEGVSSIGTFAFAFCRGLTSVSLPSAATTIGASAFNGCTSLESVSIPEGVSSIGRKAFYECSNLTSVSLPSTVTSIGESAFSGCTSLESVYYCADQLIEGDANIFSDESYEKATLYLTEAGYKLSSSVAPWKNFKNIKQYNPAGIEDVIADFDEEAPYEVYNLSGVKVGDSIDALAPGLYIVRQGRAVKKIAVK